MDDPTLPCMEIELGTQTYKLSLDHAALWLAEEELVDRYPDVNLIYTLPPMTIAIARVLFAASLGRFHPEIEYEQALGMVSFASAPLIAAAVRAAWWRAMPGSTGKGQEGSPGEVPTRTAAWSQRVAFARVDLGLSMADFMALCPRQFEALRTRYRAKIEEQSYLFELMMAQQAAITFNSRMTYAKEPEPMASFMRSKRGDKSEQSSPKRIKPRTKKAQAKLISNRWDTIMKMCGIKEIKGVLESLP